MTVSKAPKWNKLFTITEKGSVKTYVAGNESGIIYLGMSEAIKKPL